MTTFRTICLVLTVACLSLPAAAQGSVTLYEHTGFRGPALSVASDLSQLAGTTLGDDRVSSVRVAPGCTVTLYEHPGFRGERTVLTADTAALVGSPIGDDRTSSLRVRCATSGPHGVVLYSDVEFRGHEAVFYADTRDLRPDVFGDDSASSIRVPEGCSVTLYEHPNYQGSSETLFENDPVLANNRIGNDVVSSLRLRCDASGGRSPAAALDEVYRCLDRDGDVAIVIDSTGRDRGHATLLLGGAEVAAFQARLDGDMVELSPAGRADGELLIDLGRREIAVQGRDGGLRTFCRWG